MDLKKILEMLGVDKLEEGKQDEVKQGLETVVEARAKEKADEMLQEQKEQLIEEMEGKFDDYKKDITSKFSNFVDSILEEELVIPDKVMEFARKGELYADLIEQFKLRLSIDEGLMDEEIKDLLREAKEEIVSHREEIDTLTSDKLDLEMKAQELEAQLYLRKKSDGLTEKQRMRVFELMEDITDTDEIDRKFDLIVESIRLDEQETYECMCPEDGEMYTSKKPCPQSECPDHPGTKMKPAKKEKEESGKKKEKEMEEGHLEVENDDDKKEVLNEEEKEDSPFKDYLEVLRSNKF